MSILEDIKFVDELIKYGYVHKRKYEVRGEDMSCRYVEVHDRNGCPLCDRRDAWERLKQRLGDLYE